MPEHLGSESLNLSLITDVVFQHSLLVTPVTLKVNISDTPWSVPKPFYQKQRMMDTQPGRYRDKQNQLSPFPAANKIDHGQKVTTGGEKILIAMLSNWRHSGFQVFCGQRLFPQDETAMENLARYIIRASFSQERMQYLAEPSKVVYRAKDGTEEKVFDALEWLAAMCSPIPDRGEQMVRYYRYYSNVSRGKRKETEDDGVPCILEADKSSKEYRKNWARLIQKIYEVDPLTCPKCWGIMRIISFIEDREVIKAILKHLGLWLVKSRPTPKAHAPAAGYIRDPFSQLPMNDDHLYRDPDYAWDAYLQS
jgi:hypothetical protein